MDKVFFLDYSEDEVIPLSCDRDLFDEYQNIRTELKEPCDVFDSKEELLETALEYAGYGPRDGTRSFEALSREEMREENISYVSEKLAERRASKKGPEVKSVSLDWRDGKWRLSTSDAIEKGKRAGVDFVINVRTKGGVSVWEFCSDGEVRFEWGESECIVRMP